MSKTIEFIESRETLPLRRAIGCFMLDLGALSGKVYDGNNEIIPGLDIRQLPEYLKALSALSDLREAAARKYHEQNKIPL